MIMAAKGNKNAVGNKGGGRKSDFKPEYCEAAIKLCKLGATDKELADFFKVSEQTINTWKLKHPDFSLALKEGKELADANVADRLYQRAMGYEHEDTYFSNYQGVVSETKTVKHYPPDSTAAIFWLKNRRPKEWRDKQEIEFPGTISLQVTRKIIGSTSQAEPRPDVHTGSE